MLALSILTRGNSGTIALQGPCPRGGEELMSFDWHTTPPLHVTVATMRHCVKVRTAMVKLERRLGAIAGEWGQC